MSERRKKAMDKQRQLQSVREGKRSRERGKATLGKEKECNVDKVRKKDRESERKRMLDEERK